MKTPQFSIVFTMSAKYHPGQLLMSFRCPGLPKMAPSVSKVSPRVAQWASKDSPRHPKTLQMALRCTTNHPKDPQSDPKGVHGEPRASKVSPKAPKVTSKIAYCKNKYTEQLELYHNLMMFPPNHSSKTPSIQTSSPERTSMNFENKTQSQIAVNVI